MAVVSTLLCACSICYWEQRKATYSPLFLVFRYNLPVKENASGGVLYITTLLIFDVHAAVEFVRPKN